MCVNGCVGAFHVLTLSQSHKKVKSRVLACGNELTGAGGGKRGEQVMGREQRVEKPLWKGRDSHSARRGWAGSAARHDEARPCQGRGPRIWT